MSFVKFTVFEEGSEDEGEWIQFSNIIEEEEYEEEPEGFQGFQKGFSEEGEGQNQSPVPRPWDPSEPVWAVLDRDEGQGSCK
jgi:hypothetical protein